MIMLQLWWSDGLCVIGLVAKFLNRTNTSERAFFFPATLSFIIPNNDGHCWSWCSLCILPWFHHQHLLIQVLGNSWFSKKVDKKTQKQKLNGKFQESLKYLIALKRHVSIHKWFLLPWLKGDCKPFVNNKGREAYKWPDIPLIINQSYTNWNKESFI